MRLPDLEAWAIFAAVAEHRSFSAAAEAVGLSKATVSKAVSRLEAQLGQSLFHRTSRRLALTETGKPLAERAARMLNEARCAEESAHDAADALAGRIRLAAPMTFGVAKVAPLLTDYVEADDLVEPGGLGGRHHALDPAGGTGQDASRRGRSRPQSGRRSTA